MECRSPLEFGLVENRPTKVSTFGILILPASKRMVLLGVGCTFRQLIFYLLNCLSTLQKRSKGALYKKPARFHTLLRITCPRFLIFGEYGGHVGSPERFGGAGFVCSWNIRRKSIKTLSSSVRGFSNPQRRCFGVCTQLLLPLGCSILFKLSSYC